jgi:ActR/RegA family two-component response regulator
MNTFREMTDVLLDDKTMANRQISRVLERKGFQTEITFIIRLKN